MKNGISSGIAISTLIVAIGGYSGVTHASSRLDELSLSSPSAAGEFAPQLAPVHTHENSDIDTSWIGGSHGHHHDSVDSAARSVTLVQDSNGTFIV